MDTLKNLAEIIDKVNNWVGQLFSWSIIVIMILIVFEVISRWVFNSPTIWGLEVITMVYGFHFMMVAAYALLHGSLINIDLLYRYLPERKKAILDILTYLLFFFPFVIISIIYGFEFALESWKGAERASSIFSPVLYPFKAVIPAAFMLLFCQGVSELAKSIYILAKGKQQ